MAGSKKPQKIENDVGRQVIFTQSYADNIIGRVNIKLFRNRNLYSVLDSTIEDGDVLLVYHSLAYIDVLKKIRKKYDIRLVIQVNDIYSDVIGD